MKTYIKIITFLSFLPFIASGQVDSNLNLYVNNDFNWKITFPDTCRKTLTKEGVKIELKGKPITYVRFKNPNEVIDTITEEISPVDCLEMISLSFENEVVDSISYKMRRFYEKLYQKCSKEFSTKVDSLFSFEKVDSLTFQKVLLKFKIDNETELKNYSYYRIFGNKVFVVDIIIFEEKNEEILLNIWKNSTFY